VSGHTDESKPKGKGTATDAEGSLGADDSERVYCIEPGAAKRLGGYVWEGLAPTLRTEVGDNRPSVAYGISSYNSNAMKSDNPHSGIYEADTSRTLDGNGGNPSCNQGGIAIVESVPYTLKIRSGCEGGGKGALIQKDKSATLSTLQDQTLFQPVYSVENHPNDSRVGINEDGKVQALTSRMGTGGGNVPMVMQQCYSKQKRAQSATDNETWVESDTANTLNAFDVGDVRTTEAVVYCLQGGGITSQNSQGIGYAEDKSYTINTIDRHAIVRAVDCRNGSEDEVNGALQSGASRSLNCNNVVRTCYIVRRLTPLECERLQGYPDNWTQIGEVVGYDRQIDERTGEEYVQAIYEYIDENGKKRKTSDAARYKALGNSIALPPWKWVLKRICACYERDATMASLFDGIGGFPYLWEQLNGKGSCLWASEIEEFPMAVTKVRIG
jgi:DNA (cytosine-5)-methyltransferase 1